MNSSWLMDAGIFVVSFGTAFYVLGRLGRKQAAKAVKKADTKVRSAAAEREAARKSADLTIRQLGNEKLAVITGDLTTFTEIFSKIENVDFEAGSRAAEMADFVPGGDENRRLQAGIARIRRLERNDDPDLRGLRIRALGVSDAETLFERASGKNEISYSSSINATVKWLMTGKVEGDVFGPDANNSVFVGFGDGPSHTRGEEKASSFRTKMYPQEAEQFEAESKVVARLAVQLCTLAEGQRKVLESNTKNFHARVKALKRIVDQEGYDWNKYGKEDRRIIALAARQARNISVIVTMGLLHDDGSINREILGVISLLKFNEEEE